MSGIVTNTHKVNRNIHFFCNGDDVHSEFALENERGGGKRREGGGGGERGGNEPFEKEGEKE